MHEHCTHENLKYCSHCDITYCLDCKAEWGKCSLTHHPYTYIYPYTQPNITTTPIWTTSGTANDPGTLYKSSHSHA